MKISILNLRCPLTAVHLSVLLLLASACANRVTTVAEDARGIGLVASVERKEPAVRSDPASPTEIVELEFNRNLLEKNFAAIEEAANIAREKKERLKGGY